MASDSPPPPGFPPPPANSDGASAAPPRKKSSGCLIALIVMGVLVVIGGVAIVGSLYWYSTTDQGKIVVQAFTVAAKATQGPGPDALRAAGCKEGAVLRYDKMNDIVKPLVQAPDGGPEDTIAFPQNVEVRCMDPSKPITCDDVAKLFVNVEHPTTQFQAIVSGNGQERCNVTMKPDGTPK